MDRDQQRQNKRSTVSGFSCTAGAELTPLKSPTGRSGADCDPTPVAPVPFAPVTPPPCPPPLPVPLNLPPGLTVSNDTTTAYCPSTAGYSVTGTTAATVTAGTQQQIVLFTSLDNITENQLNYLYEVVPTSSTAIIAAALSGATSTVINLTHLNYAQSEELIITIQDAKFTVNTLAVDQARNLLVCQVENNLQVARCPSGAYFGPTAAVPSSLPYVPSATSSTGSFLVTFALTPTAGGQTAFALLNIPSLTAAAAQANSLALAQAESTLRCVYGNAATAAACCTSQAPGNNLGFTYCVPATGPTIPGSATAVGYFSVPQNTIFSVVSATEANSVARELSRNSLNCYFPSVGITATCAGTGPTGLGLTGTFAPASTTSTFLEPGSVILYDLDSSVTAANAQAIDIALASLNCFWSNAGVTAFCPASPGFTAINNQYYILAASPTASINYSSFVAADTVISYTSQAEANAQALELASANVSCIYCNNSIAPTCSGGVNETIGTEKDIICNVLAEVAQNTAISLGNILVSTSNGGANCCYGNEGVTNSATCSAGAYFSGDPSDSFTSADVFYIPPNVITVCAEDPAPPTPTLLYPYSNLFATNVAQVGCCSDILLCGGITGSVTPLPTLWAASTNLFDVIATGATFYTDDDGVTPYAFPAGSSYVVSRAGTRTYRGITGGTGYTIGLTSCNPCGGLNSYEFRGSTSINYSSEFIAQRDIFCSGPTAQTITLYTYSENPFTSSTAAAAAWYLDSCGASAFNPVITTGTTGYYYAGHIIGSTGYMLLFTQLASNTATVQPDFPIEACPNARYPYSVYIGATACGPSGATTLYGAIPAPQLFTSSTSAAAFYTTQWNDSSRYSYPSGTGFINYEFNTAAYYRSIFGINAQPPNICSELYPVTVQWSSTAAADVCNYPNFFDANNDGVFNDNIRTVWCDVENPFTDGASATFYVNAGLRTVFQPGGTTTYLSKFTPGDTYRNAYRQYTSTNPTSSLVSYTGAFKASPFEYSQGLINKRVWVHSATASYMGTTNPQVPNTKLQLNNPSYGCSSGITTYSDIKLAIPDYAFPADEIIKKPLKTLLLSPVGNDVYSNYLLFDGVGYELSSAASGTANQNTITLNNLSKVGAGFTGAVVRAAQVNRVGNFQLSAEGTAIPTYISSIDQNSGLITLGGYYNKVNTTFSNEALYVTGFKIEAGSWNSTQFTCYGDHCNKLEVGHSLFSYYAGASGVTSSIGYVTRVVGNTIYYVGAPSYNNFVDYDIGTGASHGSGHVYIQGRQFARFWSDDNKAQPINYDLQDNTYNYMWRAFSSDASVTFTVAKNLVLGNTAGSTSEFIIAGANYNNTYNNPSRPYTYTSSVYFNYDTMEYQYDEDYYSCNGSYEAIINPVFSTSFGTLESCCDILSPSGGGTAESACNWYNVYGETAVDPSSYYGACDYLAYNGGVWYDASTKTILDDTYRILSEEFINIFNSSYFVNGQIVASYPCNSTYPGVGGTTFMRDYMGYYNPETDPPSYPEDCAETLGGCQPLDNPLYWGMDGNPQPGYVFREYEADGSAVTGCNSNNYVPIEFSLTSGYRYTLWSSTAAAWENVNQLGQIARCGNPSCGNSAAMPFNPATAGCALEAPASFAAAPLTLTSVDDALNVISYTPEVIGFNPSAYSTPTPFNFENMPSVGGTAEDLKAEATQIAQNIVNSFVRCFYFNSYQVGATCADPDDILAQRGYVQAGEVVSNISLLDANNRAKQIADSRTICLSPDIIGGVGCLGTEISNAQAESNIGEIDLSFPKNGCSFTPTMTFTSNIIFRTSTVRKITLCSSSGESLDMYIPTLPSGQFPEDSTFELAVANPL